MDGGSIPTLSVELDERNLTGGSPMSNKRLIGIAVAAAWPFLASCSGASAPSTETKPSPSTSPAATETQQAFFPVSIETLPDADCTLHPEGSNDPSERITVYADDEGVAHFQAIHATALDTVRTLSLECRTDKGEATTHVIDLTSPSTFESAPRSTPAARMRPALTDDPMTLTQAQLLRSGYGIRPDPLKAPAHYAAWLKAVQAPAKRIAFKPGRQAAAMTMAWYTQDTYNWGGYQLYTSGVRFMLATTDYVLPHSRASVGTSAYGAMWAGIGTGHYGGLIQNGIQIAANRYAAGYQALFEYFSEVNPNNDPCVTTSCPLGMAINEGDEIYSEAWACDEYGELSIDGGYGCFYLQDVTSGQYWDCYLPQMDPACHSVRAPEPFHGSTGDIIMERLAGTELVNYGHLYASTYWYDDSYNYHDFSTDNYLIDDLINHSNVPLMWRDIRGATQTKFTFLQGL
jgi:hypothetical protein